MQESQLTTADATGSVSADYDTVAFSIAAQEHGKNGPAAKAALQKRVAKIEELYRRIQATTKIDEDSKQATNGLQPRYEYNQGADKNEYKGYDAWYQMSFSISDVEKVSEIQDLLTSLDGVTVSAPEFSVKDQESLKNKAVADAYKQTMRRFKNECRILGLDPEDYAIAAYRVNYMDRGRHGGARAAMAVAAAAAPEPMEVEAGKATVTVNLSVTFARKASANGKKAARGAR